MASDRPKGRTSEVGHLDLEIGRRNHRSLELGQAGTAGQPENMAGATGDLVTDGSLTETSGTASIAATPTAADQPTSLSSPLIRSPLTLPAPYPLAHISATACIPPNPQYASAYGQILYLLVHQRLLFSIMRPNALFQPQRSRQASRAKAPSARGQG